MTPFEEALRHPDVIARAAESLRRAVCGPQSHDWSGEVRAAISERTPA